MTNNNNEISGQPNGVLSSKTIKTFEQLLNETSPTVSQLASPNSMFHTPLTGSVEVDKLKTDLNKSRVQLEHLNELLNESELNNNRLNDQINLLKEEIRRFFFLKLF